MVATQIKTYAELEALQKDPAQYVEWMAETVAEKLGVTPESIAASLQRALAKAALPGRLNMHESLAGGGSVAAGIDYNQKLAKAKQAGFAGSEFVRAEYGSLNGDFDTMGKYVAAVYATKNGGTHPKLKAALAEAAGSLGGFLVPEIYNMELRMLQLEQAQFRGKATVLPMTSMIEHWPYVRDTSHVSSVFGGIIGYWEAEAALLSDSEPSFDQLTLTAHKLTAYTIASNEVITDSGGAIEAFISQQFPKALNFFEERAYWKGQGGGQPMGILNAPALYSVTRDTSGHIDYTDIVNMATHILPSSENTAVWFASPSVKPDLYQMSLSIGTGGSAMFINPLTGGAANTPPNQILGRPLIFTEHMKALGTAGDIVLADLSYYLIGDRQTMALMASPHVKFVNDQTVFRLIERLDGQPWLKNTLTLEDGSTVVSPFVALTT